jgi:hypothetical protein
MKTSVKTSVKIPTLAALLVILMPAALLPLASAQTPPQNHAASGAAMQEEKPPVPPSKSLNLSFEGKTITLSLTDLANMPQTTVHVHNAHRNTDETYSGPLLSDVLARIGLKASRETEPLILHSTIVATGTDHYYVLYSGAEVQPTFSSGKVIVAVMKFGLPDAEGGLIQLINTSDAKPARWVHGLMSISVMSLAPTN